ncbi:MAG: serine--tRNA ligase, partial [Selenomonas sp.]|nr:serine--tRNA ligase [Selenomonas sp.]
MLDIKFVREHLDDVKTMLKNRCNGLDLSEFEGLEQKRRELLQETEALKARRNTVSKQVGQMKKNGEDATEVMNEMREVGAKISALDADLKDVEEKLRDIMLHIPNMPKEDVPIGKDDTENPEVRKWGEPRKFDFEPKAHWDIGTELDI